jgi:hypothetical protein
MQHLRAALQGAECIDIRAGHEDLSTEVFEAFIERMAPRGDRSAARMPEIARGCRKELLIPGQRSWT